MVEAETCINPPFWPPQLASKNIATIQLVASIEACWIGVDLPCPLLDSFVHRWTLAGHDKAKRCFSSAEESYNTVPCVAIHGLFAAKVCSHSSAHAEGWTQIEPAGLPLNQYYFFKK